MKCKNCKKCNDCKDDSVEWCKKCKILSEYFKNFQKLYEDFDFYLEYEKVIKNTNFMFKCLKCRKKSPFIADYFIAKCFATFEYWRTILKNISCP